MITTVAGNFLLGSDYDGDTGPATTAQMYGPNGVIADGRGNLYIADLHNNAVRKVDVTTALLEFDPVTVGQSSAPQKIAISDIGSSSLSFLPPFTITGDFQLQTPGTACVSDTPLASGATCFLGVVFAPSTAGSSLNGSLTITDDGAGSPHVVSLRRFERPRSRHHQRRQCHVHRRFVGNIYSDYQWIA